MSLTVRRALPDDADRLGEIHVSAWRHAYVGLLPQEFLDGLDPAARSDGWRGVLTSEAAEAVSKGDGDRASRWATHVAERDGVVIGFVGTGPTLGQDESATTGELFINVDPSAWRTGAGRALLAAADERFGDLGCTDAKLWVLEGNDRAIAFYEALGWRATGERKVDRIGAGTGSAEAPQLLFRRALS
ncbi:GNAT family N-acetyltransferase [Serinibacter arcticus]|uniref:GNAT family N-acetyltransferase n=1 Tax=Serinibacter arcticus TaxID=1655435 RepID=UPI0013050656|nr:GNAT family N-acetyltransferase [Serinibacter arcticus]